MSCWRNEESAVTWTALGRGEQNWTMLSRSKLHQDRSYERRDEESSAPVCGKTMDAAVSIRSKALSVSHYSDDTGGRCAD